MKFFTTVLLAAPAAIAAVIPSPFLKPYNVDISNNTDGSLTFTCLREGDAPYDMKDNAKALAALVLQRAQDADILGPNASLEVGSLMVEHLLSEGVINRCTTPDEAGFLLEMHDTLGDPLFEAMREVIANTTLIMAAASAQDGHLERRGDFPKTLEELNRHMDKSGLPDEYRERMVEQWKFAKRQRDLAAILLLKLKEHGIVAADAPADVGRRYLGYLESEGYVGSDTPEDEDDVAKYFNEYIKIGVFDMFFPDAAADTLAARSTNESVLTDLLVQISHIDETLKRTVASVMPNLPAKELNAVTKAVQKLLGTLIEVAERNIIHPAEQ